MWTYRVNRYRHRKKGPGPHEPKCMNWMVSSSMNSSCAAFGMGILVLAAVEATAKTVESLMNIVARARITLHVEQVKKNLLTKMTFCC